MLNAITVRDELAAFLPIPADAFSSPRRVHTLYGTGSGAQAVNGDDGPWPSDASGRSLLGCSPYWCISATLAAIRRLGWDLLPSSDVLLIDLERINEPWHLRDWSASVDRLALAPHLRSLSVELVRAVKATARPRVAWYGSVSGTYPQWSLDYARAYDITFTDFDALNRAAEVLCLDLYPREPFGQWAWAHDTLRLAAEARDKYRNEVVVLVGDPPRAPSAAEPHGYIGYDAGVVRTQLAALAGTGLTTALWAHPVAEDECRRLVAMLNGLAVTDQA